MHDDIYVNGVGVNSKFGHTLDTYWNALFNNKNRRLSPDVLDIERYNSHYTEYLIDMCIQPILNIVRGTNMDIEVNKNNCVVIGTGMGLADEFLHKENVKFNHMSQLKKKIKNILGTKWKIIIIANACCAGAQAVAYGGDLIKTGAYDNVIAGGAEAFSTITYGGFRRLNSIDADGCRPFDKKRNGINVGDGAVFFLLQKNKSHTSCCKILGSATTNDAYHIVAPSPDGVQASKAIEKAIATANIGHSSIDAVVAHGTGTKVNDQIESRILFDIFGAVDVTAPKGKIGHTGGASGAFGILTAIAMLKYQKIPYIINLKEKDETIKVNVVHKKAVKKPLKNILVNSFAFGGTNTVLVCGAV